MRDHGDKGDQMSTCSDTHPVEVVEATPDEGVAMLDQAAQEILGISGNEFLARWDRGEYADDHDPALARVAMLIPFAR